MLIEIAVTAGDNSPLDLHRMFDLLDNPRPISQVMAPAPNGADLWCDITGWNDNGPCPAQAALSEDSGEGVLLLIYGGSHGLRLRPANSSPRWNLTDTRQWGEPCLMLHRDTPTA